MLSFIRKIIIVAVINYLGIYLCRHLFSTIAITKDLRQLVFFVLLLSVLGVVIKPLLNIILKPFIFLTLGILSIIINMGLVFVSNYYTQAIVIDNNFTLFKVTFTLGVVAWLAGFVINTNKN